MEKCEQLTRLVQQQTADWTLNRCAPPEILERQWSAVIGGECVDEIITLAAKRIRAS